MNELKHCNDHCDLSNSITEIKTDIKWIKETLSTSLPPLIEENKCNTSFRQISLWVLGSSGIITFLGVMLWKGIKTVVVA